MFLLYPLSLWLQSDSFEVARIFSEAEARRVGSLLQISSEALQTVITHRVTVGITPTHSSLKGPLWFHVHATQSPRRRFYAVLSLYGSASGFSKRTNHSPCCCPAASTEGLHFWQAHV